MIENAKVGMKVRISMGNCTNTEQTCGLYSQMIRLRGSITKISHINKNGIISTDNGWSWHPADIIDISKEKPKKVKPVLFDEELLWTE